MIVLNFLLLFAILIVETVVVLGLVFVLISSISFSFHGAPYVPIQKKLVKKILVFGGVSGNDVFYDLGCGDARVLISATNDFGVKKTVGYEIALWPYLEAKFQIFCAKLNFARSVRSVRSSTSHKVDIQIHGANFFQADLSDASFVYAYLFPKPIDRLAYKLAKELPSGAKILCPSFPIDLALHPEFKLLKSEKIGKITAYLYEKT